MKSPMLIGAALVASLFAGTAAPQEWTRSGPNGSSTRSYDADSGLFSINRSGANGGSTSATVSCSRGSGLNCQRDYTLTNPNGDTVTGQRNSQRGLYGRSSTNTFTGPEGNTATRYRASPRIGAVRPRARARRAIRW